MSIYSDNPVLEAMNQRQCFREFTDQEVPQEELRDILEAAGRAPSSKNTQPWHLYDVRGEKLEAIRNDLCEAHDNRAEMKPTYTYTPYPPPDKWQARSKALGISLFVHKGIGREDKALRDAHNRANYELFGAKNVMFLAADTTEPAYGTFADCGMFLENLMVGMTSKGIGSCPMFSVMIFPDAIYKHIPGSEERTIICALAYGYPKEGSHVNAFRTVRDPIEDWYTEIK